MSSVERQTGARISRKENGLSTPELHVADSYDLIDLGERSVRSLQNELDEYCKSYTDKNITPENKKILEEKIAEKHTLQTKVAKEALRECLEITDNKSDAAKKNKLNEKILFFVKIIKENRDIENSAVNATSQTQTSAEPAKFETAEKNKENDRSVLELYTRIKARDKEIRVINERLKAQNLNDENKQIFVNQLKSQRGEISEALNRCNELLTNEEINDKKIEKVEGYIKFFQSILKETNKMIDEAEIIDLQISDEIHDLNSHNWADSIPKTLESKTKVPVQPEIEIEEPTEYHADLANNPQLIRSEKSLRYAFNQKNNATGEWTEEVKNERRPEINFEKPVEYVTETVRRANQRRGGRQIIATKSFQELPRKITTEEEILQRMRKKYEIMNNDHDPDLLIKQVGKVNADILQNNSESKHILEINAAKKLLEEMYEKANAELEVLKDELKENEKKTKGLGGLIRGLFNTSAKKDALEQNSKIKTKMEKWKRACVEINNILW